MYLHCHYNRWMSTNAVYLCHFLATKGQLSFPKMNSKEPTEFCRILCKKGIFEPAISCVRNQVLEKIYKLTLIIASLIYQIPRIHWISVPFWWKTELIVSGWDGFQLHCVNPHKSVFVGQSKESYVPSFVSFFLWGTEHDRTGQL